MTPRLVKLWIDDQRDKTPHVVDDRLAIRADFDNDRHYMSLIAFPYEANEVAVALHRMASMIGGDPSLREK